MQSIPGGLIPYNHEKYLTGKYIAETRGGFRPDEVVYLKGGKQPIVFFDQDHSIETCQENGKYHYSGDDNSSFDLFLRPKTAKKIHPVLSGFLFNSEEEMLSKFGHLKTFLKAVEVEVNEE